MYKISELIGKQSITLLDAQSRGIVFSAYFDRGLTRLKHLLLLGGDEETEFLVDYKSLSSIHSDAVVISSAAAIRPAPPAVGDAESPINLPAFNQDGKSLGFIRDIIMEDGAVHAFVTDEGEIPAGMLLSRSEIMVVFNDTGAPLKLVRPKKSGTSGAKSPRKRQQADRGDALGAGLAAAMSEAEADKNPDDLYDLEGKSGDSFSGGAGADSISILDNFLSNSVNSSGNTSNDSSSSVGSSFGKRHRNNEQKRAEVGGKAFAKSQDLSSDWVATSSAQAEDGHQDAEHQVGTPKKISPQHALPPISDINLLKYAFLLGKRLCRSIYTPSGGLVARENELVTESVIKRAKENGKLVAVALHSL